MMSLTRIIYTNEVGSVPLDWAMGAFLMLATLTEGSIGLEKSNEFNRDGSQSGSTPSVLVAFLVVMGVVGWWASRWRKPQLKTIYDLERGKYIVSRVAATR